MIISFSGLDGAGKTTQINLLLKLFANHGAKVETIYTFLPDIRYKSIFELKNLYYKLVPFDIIHIRFRLNSLKNNALMQKLERIKPKNRQLAIEATIQGYQDHCDLQKYVLFPLLRKNKVLIFDRYYYDELVFKSVYGCPEAILGKLYKNTTNADIGFYIQITANECLKRNLHRPDSKVILYQNKKYIEELMDRFNNVAEEKKLIVIDGMDTETNIARSIRQHIFYSCFN